VARHLAERASGVEPPPGLENPDRYRGDLDRQRHSTPFAERATNPAFETWGESFWNVWVTLFSGLNNAPTSLVGRLVVSAVLVVGVALAGLFTASVASILIERSLRSREVTNLEMSDHLVLCIWSPRALAWIREVHSGIVTDKRPVVTPPDCRPATKPGRLPHPENW
jgi:hypothetical protein